MALTSFLTKRINTSLFGNTANKFMLGASGRMTLPYLSDINDLVRILTL